MANAYTEALFNDKLTFPQFALLAARAFCPGVLLRGDSLRTPFPERFEPSPQRREQLAQAKQQLAVLKRLTRKEAITAEKKSLRELIDHLKCERDASDTKPRLAAYEAMLAKVEAWQPPTPGHQKLKDFMARQIRQSIEFDCRTFDYDDKIAELEALLTASDAVLYRRHHDKFKQAVDNVVYHEKRWQQEVEAVEHTNRWLAALRESLEDD